MPALWKPCRQVCEPCLSANTAWQVVNWLDHESRMLKKGFRPPFSGFRRVERVALSDSVRHVPDVFDRARYGRRECTGKNSRHSFVDAICCTRSGTLGGLTYLTSARVSSGRKAHSRRIRSSAAVRVRPSVAHKSGKRPLLSTNTFTLVEWCWDLALLCDVGQGYMVQAD